MGDEASPQPPTRNGDEMPEDVNLLRAIDRIVILERQVAVREETMKGVEVRLANYMGLTSRTARSAMIMANAAAVTNIGNEAGTAPTTITVQGSGEPLGASWFVYGNAKTVTDQIGIPITAGGTYVSEVVYTATQLTSDDVLAYMVLGSGGSTSIDTGLYVRCNNTATSFIYANVYQNKLYFGHGTRSGGTRTYNNWLSLDVNWKSGDSIGIRAEGNAFTVFQNSTAIATYVDEANAGPRGQQDLGRRRRRPGLQLGPQRVEEGLAPGIRGHREVCRAGH